jgi:hypothetical protein
METATVRAVIEAVRIERERRLAKLSEDEAASEQWLYIDEPFVNELALVALIALWHQVERRIVLIAASIRAPGDGLLDSAQFRARVHDRRMQWGDFKRRLALVEELDLRNVPYWHSMETLRHLANCYKHEPSMVPNRGLLEHIGLPLVPREPLVVSYAALPDSRCFREGLALSLGLDKNSDYCLIADELISRAEEFAKVLRSSIPVWIQRAPVSLSEFEC